MKKYIFILTAIFLLSSCSIFRGKRNVKTIEEYEQEVILPEEKEEEKIFTGKETIADFLGEYVQVKYPHHQFKKYIYVSIKRQKLYLIENNKIIKKYIVSTAAKGIGNKEGSEQTPIGLHTIKKKIGDGTPLGGRFESRVYTGKTATIYSDTTRSLTDDVTSRILWLHGEESGINKGRRVDSFKRLIYIHGTSEEGRLGTPASHGCIRMKNEDVIELYSLVEEGTPVLILKN